MECSQSWGNGILGLESTKPLIQPYRCSCSLGTLKLLSKPPSQWIQLSWLGRSSGCWFSTCRLQSCSRRGYRAQRQSLSCWPVFLRSRLNYMVGRQHLKSLPDLGRLNMSKWPSWNTCHSAFRVNSFQAHCLYHLQWNGGLRIPQETMNRRLLCRSCPWFISRTFHLGCSHWPNCYRLLLLLWRWRYFTGYKD